MDINENNNEELDDNVPVNAEEDTAEDESFDEDDAASEYNDVASEVASLEESLAEANEKSAALENELSETKDKYVRLMAEYDNYRKRTAKEKADTYSNASVKCVENLLPVIDSFERALEAECADENFKKGQDMIWEQMKAFLEKMNVTEIDALGKEFDPNLHNAIQQQDGTDYDSNFVCAVFQKGYMLGDKLIRPAMVAVAV